MVLQIEAKTRQWIGTVIIGGTIIGMIFTGRIPESQYHPYVGVVLGAFFYHIIRMLNGPNGSATTTNHVPEPGKMVNPTQPPKEG